MARQRAQPAGVLSATRDQNGNDVRLGLQARPQTRHWTARLREDQAGRGVPVVAVVQPSVAKSTPAFVPVRLRQLVSPPEIAAAPRSAIEIVVGSGRRVLVQEGFDAETLRQVVAALEVVSW